jgi:meso-butanediol dehydrogenase/(S,S)-butanediol dehydrogenase/diacetyl reductase
VNGLDGRVVVVTGGASGIGEATAERLVAAGARVALLDRDAGRLDATCERLAAATGYVVDVGRDDEVGRAIASARDALGQVGGLVTSAGIFDPDELAPAADVSVTAFERVLRVNLIGTFLAIHHALPQLVAARGAIVTIASTAGLRGHGYGAGYTASKGGVVALTRLLAFQYGGQGVRANCICPGFVATPMNAGVHDDPDAVARIAEGIPLGRIARPGEIASVACHLLGDDASYVNGQVLAVDGGATVV